MKKSLVLLVLFLVGAHSVALPQAYKETILSEFNTYFDLLMSGDYEKATDFIAEELMDFVSKEIMVQMMEQAFNSPEIDIELKMPTDFEIKKPKKIEGKYYALMKYENSMKMGLNSEEGETEEDKQSQASLLHSLLEARFGKGNVNYDEETQKYEVTALKEACAISANGKDGWKFLIFDDDKKAFMEQLLPKKLLKKRYKKSS